MDLILHKSSVKFLNSIELSNITKKLSDDSNVTNVTLKCSEFLAS